MKAVVLLVCLAAVAALGQVVDGDFDLAVPVQAQPVAEQDEAPVSLAETQVESELDAPQNTRRVGRMAKGTRRVGRRAPKGLRPAKLLKRKSIKLPEIPPMPELAKPMDELLNKAAPVPLENEKPDELDVALSAVKESIVTKTKHMAAEREWVKKVSKVIKELTTKIKKVNDNIQVLRKDTKTLIRKKRQIQNAKLQKRLQKQLKAAAKDLENLSSALTNVKSKEKDFEKNKSSIAKTINDIKSQLKKLRGKAKKAGKKGKKAKKAAKKAKKLAKKAKKAKKL